MFKTGLESKCTYCEIFSPKILPNKNLLERKDYPVLVSCKFKEKCDYLERHFVQKGE